MPRGNMINIQLLLAMQQPEHDHRILACGCDPVRSSVSLEDILFDLSLYRDGDKLTHLLSESDNKAFSIFVENTEFKNPNPEKSFIMNNADDLATTLSPSCTVALLFVEGEWKACSTVEEVKTDGFIDIADFLKRIYEVSGYSPMDINENIVYDSEYPLVVTSVESHGEEDIAYLRPLYADQPESIHYETNFIF